MIMMKILLAILLVFLFLSHSQGSVQATSVEISEALRPINCECSTDGSQLTVDCLGRADIDGEDLSRRLDTLLSSNLTHGQLTELSIINSPLTHVPRSVCRLTSLTQLHLDNNQLTRLPDRCLSNLTALVSLTATNNNITELQDGLFDGLHQLQTLVLRLNRISSIGLRVFNGSAMLTSLRHVDLNRNRIQTLEPWLYYIGINGEPSNRAVINLSNNNISAFTNSMGWKATCGMRIISIYLTLDNNPIKHFSDILNGWNISLSTVLCLNPLIGHKCSFIRFRGVSLDCDCVDFDLFKIFHIYPRVDLLNGVSCNRRPAMFERIASTIPLDQFVCELTEHCPPGCRCVHRPENATLHVDCSNTNITVLPFELPALPKSYTKYNLDFSNNRLLRHLEHRDYFVNTSILDISDCSLDTIDFELWKDLANISQVFLDGNRLQSLPSLVATISLVKTKLSFSRNPWECSCNASWLSHWLKLAQNNTLDPNSVICSSPQRLENRNIMGISEKEFCVDPIKKAFNRAVKTTLETAFKTAVIVSMSTVAGVVLVLLSAGVVVYRLRVKLYTRWKLHPFDRDPCEGEDMLYDVFLSCSSNDNLPHGNRIRRQLEQRGYRVCYPPRDFLAGLPIQQNIINAVFYSKRVVCFLTTQFLQRFVFHLRYLSYLKVYLGVFRL